MKTRENFPHVENYRACVDESVEVLRMRDHRGREMLSASNFFTYIKNLYVTHGASWPAVFVEDWKAQHEK